MMRAVDTSQLCVDGGGGCKVGLRVDEHCEWNGGGMFDFGAVWVGIN